MKTACLYLLAAASGVSAFCPNLQARTSTTALNVQARPDSSAAVKAALEASKKYGATSPEARLAWEAVEELDASDNRYVGIVLWDLYPFSMLERPLDGRCEPQHPRQPITSSQGGVFDLCLESFLVSS